jgi:signal peptidase II
MKNSFKRGPWFFWGLPVIFVVFVLDQVSKWWIVEHVFRPERIPAARPFFDWLFQKGDVISAAPVHVYDWLNLSMVWNYGVSFGMLGGQGPSVPVFLTIFACCMVVVLLVWLYVVKSGLTAVGLSLAVAGAVGNNLFDRVRFGAVIDFVDCHIGDYHWPSFNVADVAIVVGMGLIILQIALSPKKV